MLAALNEQSTEQPVDVEDVNSESEEPKIANRVTCHHALKVTQPSRVTACSNSYTCNHRLSDLFTQFTHKITAKINRSVSTKSDKYVIYTGARAQGRVGDIYTIAQKHGDDEDC